MAPQVDWGLIEALAGDESCESSDTGRHLGTTQHSTAQHSTALYSTAQYYTVLLHSTTTTVIIDSTTLVQ